MCCSSLRSFVHRIIEKCRCANKKLGFYCYLKRNLRYSNSVVLLGTPTHCNIGDAAIAIAELDFLQDNGYRVIEISVNEWKKYKKIITKKINKKTLLLHGGGNFGDLWPYEENIREEIIQSFPNNGFILMPQTFFVTSSFSNESRIEMQKKYNDNRFDLFAREKISYERMISMFPNAKCYLVPDIVLYETNKKIFDIYNIEKSVDILMVLRNDREGILDHNDISFLCNIANSNKLSYKLSDMLYHSSVIKKEDRKRIIQQKLEEIKSSKVVITDRLHAMIFAFISNVPCIILNNNNYKIKGVYKWIEENGSVFVADNIEDVPLFINKALSIKPNNNFDDRLFNKLRSAMLKGECNVDR